MTLGVVWNEGGALVSIGQPNWLVQGVLQALMSSFEAAEHVIYAVGGCVRDEALGHAVSDVDLCTDATPDQTIAIIKSMETHCGTWKAVPTGIDHGTITAVCSAGAFEITSFRTDVNTDGRHATVAFSNNIEDDAVRRDFTINAFYADRNGRVRDIVGGSADLKARRIRFIGDPAARIEEDYLRILRFFRFTASIGARNDGIDADGLAACAEHADGLVGISRERIGVEMTRLIYVDDVAPIIGAMEISGVLSRILPGASVLTLALLIDLEQQYSERHHVSVRDVATRLAALGCDDIAARLRLSKADAAKIALVRDIAASTEPAHEIGYRNTYWDGLHGLMLRWASLQQPYDAAARDELEFGNGLEAPVRAADLMNDFSGKALGDRLRYLESAWINSRFEMTKSELLALP